MVVDRRQVDGIIGGEGRTDRPSQVRRLVSSVILTEIG